jgi:hypothetical protein
MFQEMDVHNSDLIEVIYLSGNGSDVCVCVCVCVCVDGTGSNTDHPVAFLVVFRGCYKRMFW